VLAMSLDDECQFRKGPVICIWSLYPRFYIELESRVKVRSNLIPVSSVCAADLFQGYLSTW